MSDPPKAPPAAPRPPKLYVIPNETKPATCRGCKASIYFVQTAAGKMIPVVPHSRNLLGELLGAPHFIDCPKRDEFRKPR